MVTSGTAAHVPTPRQHALGLILAIAVAFLWVVSSEIVQIVLKESDSGHGSYNKPYFVSYVSLSAFVIVLIGFVRPSWRASLHCPPSPGPGGAQYIPLDSEPLSNGGTPRSPTSDEAAPVSMPTTTSVLEVEDSSVQEHNDRRVVAFNARQVFSIALVIAPLFFLSDWTFTVGLGMTSVASSSTISALTGLFTLLIGAYMNVERFSVVKLFAAFMTIGGVAIITSSDGKENGEDTVLGDLINIMSALIYAIYTTALKYKSGPPGALDVSMLFAFIGAVVLFGGIPGIFVLDFTGLETFELPSIKNGLILIGNALIGTVLSDFLWAKSIVLTTPMIGTLTLSLTVPVSIIIDFFFRGVSFSLSYLVGVTMVLSGFIIVNVDEMRTRRRSTHDSAG